MSTSKAAPQYYVVMENEFGDLFDFCKFDALAYSMTWHPEGPTFTKHKAQQAQRRLLRDEGIRTRLLAVKNAR